MNNPIAKRQPTALFAYANPADGEFPDYLGTASIIAFLKNKGIRAQQFHSHPLDTLQQTVDNILASGAPIIGFTCYNSNYYLIKTVSRELKKRNPGLHLLAGGPTAMYSDAIILRNIPEISICVRGDGEIAMQEIIEHIHHSQPLSTILGISYRDNGIVRRTPDRPLIVHGQSPQNCLDRFPSAYLSKVLDPRRFAEHGHEIPLTTSRGCVFMCAYCNCTTLSHHTIRYHSPERIIAELKFISDRLQGRNATVKITDDCFTMNKKRVHEICEGILKNNIKLTFTLLTRVDCLDTPTLKLLYRAGVRTIGFGLETAHPATLRRIGKVRRSRSSGNGIHKEREFIASMKRCVREARAIGFNVYTSIIAGLPGESLSDIESTIHFVKRLKSMCYYNCLRLFPGTELFKSAAGGGEHYSERWLQLSHNALPDTLPDKQIRHVPIISNSDLAETNQMESTAIAFFFMGLSHQDATGRLPPVYYIDGNQRMPMSLLMAKAPLASILLFSKTSRPSPSAASQIVHIRPIRVAYAHTVAQNRSFIDYAVIDRHYLVSPMVLRETNGHSLIRALLRKRDDQIRIIDIDSDILAGQFEKLLVDLRALSRRLFRNSKGSVIVRDACRWSNACPAREAKRFIVRDGCTVTSCFHGKTLGKLGDPASALQANYDRHLRAARKERGCATCPVRNECSQCPFLGRMQAQTFCSLRRRHNERIATFMSLLKLHFRSRPAAR